MEDVFNGVPPTIEATPIRKKVVGGIPDGHINLFDDRKTMLAWAMGKRGKNATKKSYRKAQKDEQ